MEIRKKQRLKAFLQIPNVSLPEFLNSPVERGKNFLKCTAAQKDDLTVHKTTI